MCIIITQKPTFYIKFLKTTGRQGDTHLVYIHISEWGPQCSALFNLGLAQSWRRRWSAWTGMSREWLFTDASHPLIKFTWDVSLNSCTTQGTKIFLKTHPVQPRKELAPWECAEDDLLAEDYSWLWNLLSAFTADKHTVHGLLAVYICTTLLRGLCICLALVRSLHPASVLPHKAEWWPEAVLISL